MTKRREWPNAAKWARDDAAHDALDAHRIGLNLLEEYNMLTDAERIRRIARMTRLSGNAARLLQSVGAPIRIE